MEEYVRAFQWQEHQAGIAFGIKGRVLGLDLFDNDQVMRRFFRKLVRSFALDALDAAFSNNGTLDAAQTTDWATHQDVIDFLAAAASAPSSAHPSIGIGKDICFGSPTLSGAALWAQERYIHICAFAQNGRDDREMFRTRMNRPAHRRMW